MRPFSFEIDFGPSLSASLSASFGPMAKNVALSSAVNHLGTMQVQPDRGRTIGPMLEVDLAKDDPRTSATVPPKPTAFTVSKPDKWPDRFPDQGAIVPQDDTPSANSAAASQLIGDPFQAMEAFQTPSPRTVKSNPLAALDWGGAVLPPAISVYFAPAGARLDGYTSEGFNAYEISQFQAAFNLLEAVCNVTFRMTDAPTATLSILLDTDEMGTSGYLGYFNPPGTHNQGIGVLNGAAWDREAGQGLEVGGFHFVTITHELLHALGLAHPHDRGGQSELMAGVEHAHDDFGDYLLNQGVFTNMSYNSGHAAGRYAGGQDIRFGFEAGPMALDIAVLQDKYGANMKTAMGDTLYQLPDRNGPGTYWRSIWDAGGTDTLRHDGAGDAVIDLRPATLRTETGGGGFLSSVEGVSGGYTIAAGVIIENAVGGAGFDRLIGNAADNHLSGSGGADRIFGGDGADKLFGGDDGDFLVGDEGDDVLFGGAGDDILVGGRGRDWLFGGAGADTFVFGTDDSGVLYGQRDVIGSFEGGIDKIHLRGIDGDPAVQGHQALHFASADNTLMAGRNQVLSSRIDDTRSLLTVDYDTDGVADLQVVINSAISLTVDDFIL